MKAAGIAVVSADNLGKDKTLGPRGSSVKMDKADAVVELTRTDGGVKLRTTHRRSTTYPTQWTLSVAGIDGAEPITYRRTNTSWPKGTEAVVELLDDLDVPTNLGRKKLRDLLREAAEHAGDPERYRVRDEVLSAAIRYRKNRLDVPR